MSQTNRRLRSVPQTVNSKSGPKPSGTAKTGSQRQTDYINRKRLEAQLIIDRLNNRIEELKEKIRNMEDVAEKVCELENLLRLERELSDEFRRKSDDLKRKNDDLQAELERLRQVR
jgi:hypothetical protein